MCHISKIPPFSSPIQPLKRIFYGTFVLFIFILGPFPFSPWISIFWTHDFWDSHYPAFTTEAALSSQSNTERLPTHHHPAGRVLVDLGSASSGIHHSVAAENGMNYLIMNKPLYGKYMEENFYHSKIFLITLNVIIIINILCTFFQLW